jgi:uncharacterized protein YndB with AHSA1/START domain
MKHSALAILRALAGSLLLTGCATSFPRGSAQLATQRGTAESIRWPETYDPAKAAFFVHNQIDIQAPPAVVWDILVHVEDWPNWYAGATDLTVNNGKNGRVTAGSMVRWETMGLKFDSYVREFEPPARFAWESRKAVIQGYHAWLLIPAAEGTRVITDESFNGFLACMQGAFIPKKLHGLHQSFLEELKRKAEARIAATSANPGAIPR